MGIDVATSMCYWGAQLLYQISEPQIALADGGELTPWYGMHPEGKALGVRKGNKPSYTITFQTPKLEDEDSQEVDWQTAADTHEQNDFEIAPLSGGTGDIHDCYVKSCELSVGKDRSMDWTVVLVSLGKV